MRRMQGLGKSTTDTPTSAQGAPLSEAHTQVGGVLTAKLPSREWKQLTGIKIAGQLCDFQGQVTVGSKTADGYGRAWWSSDNCWYRGQFAGGRIAGSGVFGMRNGDRFRGTFSDDAPVGEGTLCTLDGRHMAVQYTSGRTLLDDLIPSPVTSRPGTEYVIPQVHTHTHIRTHTQDIVA